MTPAHLCRDRRLEGLRNSRASIWLSVEDATRSVAFDGICAGADETVSVEVG